MQLSILAKSRRRRKIRAKLDEVARVVSTSRMNQGPQPLFTEAHCAILTESGELIVANNTSVRRFQAIAPKIRAIRHSAESVSSFLGTEPSKVVHVRGRTRMLHAYEVDAHTLVAVTQVSPGAVNLENAVAYIDECMGVNKKTEAEVLEKTLLEELSIMLVEI
ncbi:hypothetical protein FGB62_32g013 [Gracilaria domingensis]|nr:hypothetical protein FGB62_32g013 [Gracilaria domingensis]